VVKYNDLDFYTINESHQILQGAHRDNGSYHLMKLNATDYLCHVPQVSPTEQKHQPLLEDANKSQNIQRAYDIISESLNRFCLFNLGGHSSYWSYAFCFGKRLSQFNGGIDSFQKGEGATFVLGTFKQGEGAEKYSLNREGGVWYLRYNLEQGTVCDLTGRQRSTEVQFVCDPSQSLPNLNWVKEYKSCQYQAQVSIPGLCSDDLLGSNKEEKLNEIECKQIINTDINVMDKQDYIESSFKNHAQKISISDYFLYSAGNGIFLGTPKTLNGPNVFIYHSDEFDEGKYLKEIAGALFTSISRKRVFVNDHQLLTHDVKFNYFSYVYGRGGEYLTTVQIEKDDNGRVVIFDKGPLSHLERNLDLEFDESAFINEKSEKGSNGKPIGDFNFPEKEPEYGQFEENDPQQQQQQYGKPTEQDTTTQHPADVQEAQQQEHEDQEAMKHDEL